MANLDLLWDPAIPPLGIYPKEVKAGSQTNLYTDVHSSIIHNKYSRGGSSSVEEWVNKMWHTQTMNYYSVWRADTVFGQVHTSD